MISLTAVERRRSTIFRYLERRQLYPFQIEAKPDGELGLAVVIPCFDEPDISRVLASLADCTRPDVAVEVLVVINAPTGASPRVMQNNALAEKMVAEFAGVRAPDWLRAHPLVNNALRPDTAGVGLARKLGMDEAVGRIADTRNAAGVIASLDADCRVSKNYFVELINEFTAAPDCPGASIYFEHDEPCTTDHAPGINEYELHLRYYVAGQRHARFPYAFHTIGSAMACRADAYAKQGGMNLRQGGEDFYFVQKLITLGGYRTFNGACVYPSARLSDRVPFGTGPALQRFAAGEPLLTIAPPVFDDLAKICAVIADAGQEDVLVRLAGVSERLAKYLEDQAFAAAHNEICANVTSPTAFRKRLYRWFNAFRFFKYAQYASRTDCPKVPVRVAAAVFAEKLGFTHGSLKSTPQLLGIYRSQDRGAAGPGPTLG